MNQMEDVRNSVKVGGIKNLSVPPGFTSRTAFILKRTTSSEDNDNPAPLKNASSSLKDCSLEDYLVEANLQIKRRAWILHDQLDHPEKEPDDTPNIENAAVPSDPSEERLTYYRDAVSESVCFATLDWLHDVQGVSGLYREKQMKQLICHEKLLFEAAEKAVKSRWDYLIMGVKTPEIIKWKDACGAGKAIAVTLKACVKEEERKREFLCTKSQSKQMDRYFDEGAKKECFTCNSMLYLSAAYCRCNTRKYACLKHTHKLCSCGWSEKVFLLRFNIVQLKLLVEATEGKFHAINKWVKQIKAREPNQCVVVSEDDSSIAKSLEVGGETSKSPAELEVNNDSCTRVELAKIMSNLGVTTFDTLSPEADDSSKSDDDSCFLPFGLMEGKKPLAESHSASNGKTEVVCLSSDDED